jgi:hypothetical protein
VDEAGKDRLVAHIRSAILSGDQYSHSNESSENRGILAESELVA